MTALGPMARSSLRPLLVGVLWGAALMTGGPRPRRSAKGQRPDRHERPPARHLWRDSRSAPGVGSVQRRPAATRLRPAVARRSRRSGARGRSPGRPPAHGPCAGRPLPAGRGQHRRARGAILAGAIRRPPRRAAAARPARPAAAARRRPCPPRRPRPSRSRPRPPWRPRTARPSSPPSRATRGSTVRCATGRGRAMPAPPSP